MHMCAYMYTYKEKHVTRPYKIWWVFCNFLTVRIKEKQENQHKISVLVTSDCEMVLLFGRKSVFLMTHIFIAVGWTVSFW